MKAALTALVQVENTAESNTLRCQPASRPAIEFIANDEFEHVEEQQVLQMPAGATLYSDREDVGLTNVTAVGDYESTHSLPLLSADGEAFLFRKMNILQLRATRIVEVDDDESASARSVQESQHLLAAAEAVRNHIAECNVRLVISIARKFSTTRSDFDELVSEGTMIMLKAIDKFDVTRGFRFSTYATHSVQRHFYRYNKQKNRRRSIEMESSVELINALPAAAIEPVNPYGEQDERRLKELVARIDECLDEREQLIIRERFGLGKSGSCRTLRDIATDVGLSKERVRQIQMAAVEKLHDFFSELQPDLIAT